MATPPVESTRNTLEKINTILESVSKGTSVEKACEEATLSRHAYYCWLNSDPANKERYYTELNKCSQAVESALFKSAQGGNTTAMIFWLTNRAPKHWIHKQVQEIKADIINHASILDELEEDD